uniref:Uncharacterized protein n=1 Tax=Rhizophora mucronata TaxID=61149 RepID=A0A2P2PVE5_RHIMU
MCPSPLSLSLSYSSFFLGGVTLGMGGSFASTSMELMLLACFCWLLDD